MRNEQELNIIRIRDRCESDSKRGGSRYFKDLNVGEYTQVFVFQRIVVFLKRKQDFRIR